MSEQLITGLKAKAKELRKNIITIMSYAGSGHGGGALSMADILTVLYFHTLIIDPKDPGKEDRDRFILSKGHGALGYDPVLAMRGYFPEEDLKSFNKTGSCFGMHPDMKKIAGCDMSTGSLGHGLPVSFGLALGLKHRKLPARVFCLMGDGEQNEGSVWEAAMAGAHFGLGNLIGIVDRNMMMIDGPTEEVMGIEPLADKWRAFGWTVHEIDGHDIAALVKLFDSLAWSKTRAKPVMIIARTVKGKGVSFMEGRPEWHYGGLDSDMEVTALADIEKM